MTRLLSPEQLHQQISTPDRAEQIVVVDCRFRLADPDWGRQQYQLGHIPGAHYLSLDQDLSGPVERHGGRHPLPDPDRFAATLAQMGINRGETLVVAYDDLKLAFAARLWWLLRYLGHDSIALLNGGWAAWQAGGYPGTVEIPAIPGGRFEPQLRPEMQVDVTAVKACQDQPGTVLVDSRAPSRYRGEEEPIDPIAGHIPGAINLFWQEAIADTGEMKSAEAQRQRWVDLADAENIIVYCGSGVTACVNLISLELAGITTGKLYPGSWSDWCSYQ